MKRCITLLGLLLLAAPGLGDVRKSSLATIRAGEWDRAAAAHLLRRAGFGGTPAEIDRLAAMTVEQAVASLLDYETTPYQPAPPEISPQLGARRDRFARRELSEDERRAQQLERMRLERQGLEETRLWWLERMIRSPRPMEEKLTLFWHGHFTSGMREVRNVIFMKEQNEFLRRHAQANFRDLVEGISRDRAMLVYLDGVRNNKREPNENYARELMELFTLGVGNYSEKDIAEAARAFTGWSYDEYGFQFRSRNHDYGVKKFLGRSGKFNGDDVIEILLEQPACSRLLARKLLAFFVTPEPHKQLVEQLAKEIRRQKFELKPVLRTLLQSRAFYHPDHRGTLVKSPVELVVSSIRTLGIEARNLKAIERSMATMGQELLQPPNVKGWDGGATWINTATLFNRYNTVAALISGSGRRAGEPTQNMTDEDDPEMTMAGQMMTPAPRSRSGRASQPPYDALGVVRAAGLREAPQIVDYLAGHFLAVPLAGDKRDQLIAWLDGGGRFRIDSRDAGDTLRMLVTLICSTPEFQMQ